MDRSLPRADSRGRYFMPQSGASTMPLGGHVLQRPSDPLGDLIGGLHGRVAQVQHAQDDRLAGQPPSTEQSSPDWAVSIEIWSAVQAASSGRNE